MENTRFVELAQEVRELTRYAQEHDITIAMSVAIGIPQPFDPSPPALSSEKMMAGTIIPPNAAMIGNAA